MLAFGTVKLKGIDEKFDQLTGLTRSKVKHRYAGDIEAEARFECLTFSGDAGAANFVGLEHISGRIGDRNGGFILQHIGSVKSGRTESMLNVLSGSGTGDLVGIKGHGRTTWTNGTDNPSQVLLEYSFE
jgi:Protein of unknown function (DUF3224)